MPIEVIVYGRASCPHCRRLYEVLRQKLAKLGLDRVLIFRVVSPHESGPVPQFTRIVDMRSQAETHVVYTGFLSDLVPIVEIRIYLSDGTVITQTITQSLIPREVIERVGDPYEAIAEAVAQAVYAYRNWALQHS